ncbi:MULTISPECIES: MdtA/MuxA family multidrug efflux RND transporter periplasmic adaptor subunit [unclassified Symbiopectobacterium]|uniref:MdtA/MuxA family multidrug efflux RND transporter periplasmic adaptor subunit n=1 Tax=unclassified Symbiopectobacterium TaxID=2794573 RepID=UPI00222797BE|nr:MULTISPECIES: MdtA/MuxA family multidrug efflux RND transporter periplasmic adaptor subunit [unclassified Symbiopectobacterium]MCW2475691.1 MdtA/MuxA family multidrug efflux RND transporter periplasmic adaptor subunit [Candidatus Symbiopectobacterium sp. NZEC151]MCW2486126.1 MdtA/MuxA family multidrug efflux RND transporter periplasmic adaptor subunit [Candidatus Symbiopectobacterium sp. NZEC127]
MNTTRLFRLLLLAFAVIAAVVIWRYLRPADSPTAAPAARQEASSNAAPARNAGGGGGRRSAMRTLPPVQAATTRAAAVPYYLSGLGTITAASTVTVRSRVNGELMALHFQEGQQVKAGDLLAEIDPRPYQVALTQAQGQLAKDQAALANARQDLARYQQLIKTNLISRQELDAQAAQVHQSEGTVKADEGSVASAELQLTYSRITSPINGRVGLKQVDVGNYITSGDSTGIVVLTQTHPIDVIFTLPEGDIATVLSAQKSGQAVPVEAWDRANQHKLSQGSLLSMDNQIDATTGTIKLKARFENSDDALFPNQFVNVRMQVTTLQNALLVPLSAIQMGSEGRFVWVLNDKNQVSKHSVTVGIQYGQEMVVTAGLNEGDRVVTDGIDRLTEGAQVEVISAANTTTTPPSKHATRGEKP